MAGQDKKTIMTQVGGKVTPKVTIGGEDKELAKWFKAIEQLEVDKKAAEKALSKGGAGAIPEENEDDEDDEDVSGKKKSLKSSQMLKSEF